LKSVEFKSSVGKLSRVIDTVSCKQVALILLSLDH
jgi:hypothetical protein